MKQERLSAVSWWLRFQTWRRSGLSLHAYCQVQGWSYVSARSWQRKLVRELLGPLPRVERVR